MCLPVNPYKIESEWVHADLQCAVVQAKELGFRCGYVRVPPGHPLFGQDYDTLNVSVHGGLTFGEMEPCAEHDDGQGWWFGFDCAHAGDAFYAPEHERAALFPSLGDHFWTQAEVERECERLAEQLAEAAGKQVA